jgi:hypothetical protein
MSHKGAEAARRPRTKQAYNGAVVRHLTTDEEEPKPQRSLRRPTTSGAENPQSHKA